MKVVENLVNTQCHPYTYDALWDCMPETNVTPRHLVKRKAEPVMPCSHSLSPEANVPSLGGVLEETHSSSHYDHMKHMVTVQSIWSPQGCSYLYNLKHLTSGVTTACDAINRHTLLTPINGT